MIKKLLIANRGEIACRILHTARRLNIKTVLVHSSLDAKSLAASLADETICVGFAPASESYLNRQAIINAALQTGAEAIHPGYGFLSEDSQFATLCAEHSLIFIGPPAKAIEQMADKTRAKMMMQQAGVPVTPGDPGESQSIDALTSAALSIGFPLLVKATAGGGGKGMRLVTSKEQIADAIQSAQNEAKNSFANSHVFLEKYINPARHVEVQVFTDQHGNGVYLFDRDCSLQRRHQKVIEEAPAPGLSDDTRQRMGEIAVKGALAIGYVGAGTVEFLVDENENFYFMEMNTRLQVEHPVTEMITGVDLVEWQCRVASGEPLPLQQQQLKIKGHAIEARVYAENPANHFSPSVGDLLYLSFATAEHTRIDTGVQQGDRISMYYDPMIAKVITWGSHRGEAIDRLKKALAKTCIAGVHTNVKFLIKLLTLKAFVEVSLSTQLIETHLDTLISESQISSADVACAALAYRGYALETNANEINAHFVPFWRLEEDSVYQFTLWHGKQPFHISISKQVKNHTVLVDGIKIQPRIDQQSVCLPPQIYVFGYDADWVFSLQRPLDKQEQSTSGQHRLHAPMPGNIVSVFVKVGDRVQKGQKLLTMEAMKMEHSLYAENEAEVMALHCEPGQQLQENHLLIELNL